MEVKPYYKDRPAVYTVYWETALARMYRHFKDADKAKEYFDSLPQKTATLKDAQLFKDHMIEEQFVAVK